MTNPEYQIVADDVLLETKLFAPRWRQGMVRRPRLVERLDQATGENLILLSAPAGFGKTTLLSEWLAASAQDGPQTAWISLDRSDNDPPLFWAYFFAGIRKIQPEIGERGLDRVRSSQPPPIESVLTTFINDVSTIDDNITLILDDFHTIDNREIQRAIAFLIDHLPHQMRIVIASRSDPPFPLNRYRGRGNVVELRASDLRFTLTEATAFLNELMDLKLAPKDLAVLEFRTEGWIAGLQLAALSMRGRDDVSDFINAFAGDDRYIVDYLIEEVLDRQSESLRSFLLQTAILDTLSGPLCDAVTNRDDSGRVLEELERANLFVVPLDDRRQWYRYHHLFADVLRAQAQALEPDLIPVLNRSASIWFEENTMPAEAIRHALAGEDFGRASDLVEVEWRRMDRSHRSATWLRWAKSLPEEQIRVRPVLGVGFAWALLEGGELEAGRALLEIVEQQLAAASNAEGTANLAPTELVVSDHEEFQFLTASIATARAYHAKAIDDLESTINFARQALEQLPEDEHVRRGSPSALLALASWSNGDLGVAEQSIAKAIAGAQVTGDTRFVINGTFVQAAIRKAQGRLHAAFDAYQRALHLAELRGETWQYATADLHTGLAELHCEWGDLDTAEQHLRRSKQLADQMQLPHWDYRWSVARSRLEEARGELETALERLADAELQYVRGPVPDVIPIAAIKARLHIRLGRLSEAMNWALERGITVDNEASYLSEYESLILARILLARYERDGEESCLRDAHDLLERLLQAAEAGQRTGSVISILTSQALAFEAQEESTKALGSLERALSLAEPEGYLRLFVNEGEPMHDILRRAVASGVGGAYALRLLSAFDESATSSTQSPDELIEPLTPRELEVLRHVAAGMTNRDIAEQLFISVSTVKRHIANIYGKLNVGHRTEAVARANQLKLLN